MYSRSRISLGFGASAISALPQGYVQNLSTVPAYRGAMVAGILPTARGIGLTQQDRLRRAIIERLMCDLRVNLAPLLQEHAPDGACLEDAFVALAPLVADGVVTLEGSWIAISPDWRAATRVVCACFDPYLGSSKLRHSMAV